MYHNIHILCRGSGDWVDILVQNVSADGSTILKPRRVQIVQRHVCKNLQLLTIWQPAVCSLTHHKSSRHKKTRLRGLFHKASANWRLSQFVDLCSQVSLMTCSFVLWIRPLAAWRSTIGCISLNAFCAAALSPASIAAYTFLMKVRIIERRLALCLRAFSDWMARFLADLILAKVQLPNVFYMDNSKAEEYALLAFFCQWICANKRR